MARLPLYDPPPARAPDDPSRFETIAFRSAVDGRECAVDVYAPSRPVAGPLPLVVAPHPIGWTAAEEYWGGLNGLVRGHSRGWRGLPDRVGFVLAVPHGHPREVALNSLGYRAQIADLRDLADILAAPDRPIDRRRIYAAGLSMGAQEALLFAGRYSEVVAAAVAFNPVVDVAAWHDDLEASEDPDIRAYRTWDRIRQEVGGLPAEVPDEYWARSPLSVAADLADVPTLIVWSRHDAVVPRQVSHHALALASAVRAAREDAPLATYEHTAIHALSSISREDGWRLHEWCDYELAIGWLLAHARPPID